ncbi:hypothetical protein Nans01_10780 [Nocardiopsis ansamitocini]|uniref:Lipoyl-binding domain-containing protein n=2 Tax=Nocardiopsis ansamitocini TaxID=1670832 RepID=A0A9W6UHH0_9ACTN|nr:hypothetical protein Nans01_10780 [Nocardiopsis ansamitocini]
MVKAVSGYVSKSVRRVNALGDSEGRTMVEIRAETVANVWKVLAAEGDVLEEGAAVVILESMKMEIPVLVEDPGTLVQLVVSEGDVVREGDLLAVVD